MFEFLTSRKISTSFGVAAGALVLAGCSGKVHGVASVELLDCKSGPKTNEFVLENFNQGSKIEVGKDIDTYERGDGSGEAVQGPLEVISAGEGSFLLRIRSEGGDYTDPNHTLPQSHYTFIDQDHQYQITGTPNENGSTSLEIDAECITQDS